MEPVNAMPAHTQAEAEESYLAAMRMNGVPIYRIDELTPDPENARDHPDFNLETIAASLQEFGQQKPVVIGTDYVITAGNGTWTAAKALGWLYLGANITNLEGESREAFGIADNQTALSSRWNYDVLGPKLKRLADSPISLKAIGFDREALEAIASGGAIEALKAVTESASEGTDDPGPEQPEISGPDREAAIAEARGRWATESGQLWEVPSLSSPGRTHRLVIGDSEDRASVSRLLAGEQPHAVLTDPPYGTASENKVQYVARNVTTAFNHEWDKVAPLAWVPLSVDALAPGGALVSFWDNARVTDLWAAVEAAGINPLQTVYWRKPILPQPRPNFCSSVETGVFGRKAGKVIAWNGGGATHNVFDCPRAGGHEWTPHPTQKPLKLWTWLLQLVTDAGHLVYDPFLGSGTTLAAAEASGRVGAGLELDPGYVALILDRLAGLGLAPRLAEEAKPEAKKGKAK